MLLLQEKTRTRKLPTRSKASQQSKPNPNGSGKEGSGP